MKFTRIRAATLLLCFATAYLIGEYGLLYIYTMYWDFPQRGMGSDVVKILLVSDAHVANMQNDNHWLSMLARWDADSYLSQSFAAACRHVKPEMVVFLGDLMDGGSRATDADFRLYSERVRRVFSVPDGVSAVYLPGGHDIGGDDGEAMSWKKVGRFVEEFGKPNLVVNFKELDFVKINTVIWLRNQGTLNEDETNFLKEFSLFLGVIDEDRRSFHAPIVFSHVPLSHNREARDNIFKQLRPRVVFSGHTHKAKKHKFELEEMSIAHYKGKEEGPLDVTDYTVPTCNYQVAESGMGYAAALLGPTGKAQFYTILWLPPRYPTLFIYIILIIIFIAFLCWFRR